MVRLYVWTQRSAADKKNVARMTVSLCFDAGNMKNVPCGCPLTQGIRNTTTVSERG